MTPSAQTANFTPVFEWAPPRRRRLSLAGFLLGSLVLHALCFYLFQVVYPLTTSLTPPPARVSLISPRTEEGRALLEWLAAEDPALASTTMRAPESTTALPPAPAHRPSYQEYKPALRELPTYRADLRIPSAYPPGPAPLPRARAVDAPAQVPTRVEFTPAPGDAKLPPLHFTAASNEPPRAAHFRIAIDRAGAVRHVLLEESSGDRALDEQARRLLLLARFAASVNDAALRWTLAVFQWGNDIAAPAPSSPPPPSSAP